jgi:APA family basic amino acid/polyamine antiporter
VEAGTDTATARAGPALERRLGLFPAANLVVGNMVGAGIFTTSGLLMGELGDASLMLLLWLAGGILALCGALCYGALGAAMPQAGGECVYLSQLYHPLLGFLTGWVSFFVGFSAPLAASALGCSEYLARAFPVGVAWGDPDLIKKLGAVLVIGALGAVHLRGIEVGARVQNWLTGGKVLLIVLFVAAGFALGEGSWAHLAGPWAGVDGPMPAHTGGRTAGLALLRIMFAYSGWNASAYVGSELRDPGRTLPRSLLVGTGVVILLYLGLNLLFVYALSPREMTGVIAVGGLASSRLFGGPSETVLSALIAFALLSSVSALIVLGPRVYWAMARDGSFFRFAARVHPVFRVPSRSILLQCGLAAVMVASGTFDQILTYMGFCLGIFPILAVLGVFRLPHAAGRAGRVPGHPLPALVFVAGMGLTLILSFQERPVESTIALATVGLGVPAYFGFQRSRRRSLPWDPAAPGETDPPPPHLP